MSEEKMTVTDLAKLSKGKLLDMLLSAEEDRDFFKLIKIPKLQDKLAALRAENAALKEKCSHEVVHKEVLGHTLCVCCSHCQKENQALRAEIAFLLEALLREKDKTVTQANEELREKLASQSQQIGELVEALKDIKAHSVEPFNAAKWFSYINYISDKVLRSVEQSESKGSVSDKGEK